MRKVTAFERLICEVDVALRTLLPAATRISSRPSPANDVVEEPLSHQEKNHISGLMRVNLAGEVCAQALYRGQALTAKQLAIRSQMAQAAEEEVDHLAWCEQRLRDLESQSSVLNIFWYLGSFLLGSMAGLAGDHWSLGFVVETEKQVAAHLQKHLHKVPKHDKKTKAILQQMHEDEVLHAEQAEKAGAAELPSLIKTLMRQVSRLMTHSSYYI